MAEIRNPKLKIRKKSNKQESIKLNDDLHRDINVDKSNTVTKF
jgi:hypothetical protein